MTKESIKGKKLRARFLAPVSTLALVIIFFLAPIIPVDVAYPCFVGGPPLFHYTDWQSPSYHLFHVGYHYWEPHIYCQ